MCCVVVLLRGRLWVVGPESGFRGAVEAFGRIDLPYLHAVATSTDLARVTIALRVAVLVVYLVIGPSGTADAVAAGTVAFALVLEAEITPHVGVAKSITKGRALLARHLVVVRVALFAVVIAATIDALVRVVGIQTALANWMHINRMLLIRGSRMSEDWIASRATYIIVIVQIAAEVFVVAVSDSSKGGGEEESLHHRVVVVDAR